MARVAQKASTSETRWTKAEEEAGWFRWERYAYLGMMAVGLLMRLHDLGTRAMHHDESLHTFFSWNLYMGRGYVHDPMMHGPFQFHLNALIFFLFGPTDFTARLAYAVAGTILIGLPYFLRHELGRRGALAAAFLLTISPAFLYFSRFARNDIYIAVFSMFMVIGIFGHLRTGEAKYVLLAATGLALSFASKEVTFITAFIYVTFFLLVLGVPVLRRAYPAVAASTRAIGAETWVQSAVIFMGINLVLYTTFFTNPRGLCTMLVAAGPFCQGSQGALQYWLAQQDVARGGQPWYYYLMLVPLYEFVPLVFAVAAVIAVLRRYALGLLVGFLWLFWVGFYYYQVAAGQAPWLITGTPIFGSKLQWGTVVLGLPFLVTVASMFWPMVRGTGSLFFWFTLYWAVAAFVIYSWAAEKMPWLVPHLALPVLLLGAQFLDRWLGEMHLRTLRRPEFLKGVGLALLGMALLAALVNLSTAQVVVPIEVQRLGLQRLFALLALGGAIGGIVYLAGRYGRRLMVNAAAAGVSLTLVVWYVHTSWTVTYANSDTPRDPLIYVQSSPDVTWVVREIERIGYQTGQGKDLKILLDNGYTENIGGQSVVHESIAWPFEWYLRDYKNRRYFSRTFPPDVNLADYPVVLVMAPNLDPIRDVVTSQYTGQKYKLNWWFPEDYKGLTLSRIVDYLSNPSSRAELVKFLAYRELPRPLDGREFYFFVRNEVPTLGPAALPGQATARAVLPIAPAAREAVLVQAGEVSVFGRSATGQPLLRDPKGIAVDATGRLFVTEGRGHALTVFNPDGSIAFSFGRQGNGDGEFAEPWGVAVDADGSIYVADTWNHRVQKFDSEGRFVTSWGSFADTRGQVDTNHGMFWGPRDIAISRDGRVYVADTGNKRVQVFDRDGRFLEAFGGAGAEPGRMQEPVGLALDRDGNLYVADTWNKRVQKLDPHGKFLEAYPVEGWESRSAANKPYLAVDDRGRVFATLPEKRAVVMLDRGVARPVTIGTGTVPGSPVGIRLIGQRLFVSDSAAGVVYRLPVPD